MRDNRVSSMCTMQDRWVNNTGGDVRKDTPTRRQTDGTIHRLTEGRRKLFRPERNEAGVDGIGLERQKTVERHKPQSFDSWKSFAEFIGCPLGIPSSLFVLPLPHNNSLSSTPRFFASLPLPQNMAPFPLSKTLSLLLFFSSLFFPLPIIVTLPLPHDTAPFPLSFLLSSLSLTCLSSFFFLPCYPCLRT